MHSVVNVEGLPGRLPSGAPAWRTSSGWSRSRMQSPSAAQVSEAVLGDAAMHRMQPASTSGRDTVDSDSMQQRSKGARRRQQRQPQLTSSWDSGYQQDGKAAGMIKFLDMEHLSAAYEETVFPAAQDPDPTRMELNRHILKAVLACQCTSEVLGVVSRDAALMDPGTTVAAMRAVSDLWLEERSSWPQRRQQQRQRQRGDQGAAKGLAVVQDDVDAGMEALLLHLAADLSQVRLKHVSSAVYHLGHSRFHLRPPPPDQLPSPPSAPLAQPVAVPRYSFQLQPHSSSHTPPSSPSAPSASASLTSLLSLCQPDLFLASPEELCHLAQGLGYLELRRQRGGGGRPGGRAEGEGGGGARKVLPQGWLQAFCKVSQSKFMGMTTWQLSRVGWALLQLGHLPDPFWVSSFINRTWVCMYQASPSALSHLCWVLMFMNRAAAADPRWMTEYQQYSRLWEESSTTTAAAAAGQQYKPNTITSNGSGTPNSGGGGGGIVGSEWSEAVWEVVRGSLPSMSRSRVAVLVHALSLLGLQLGPEDWPRVSGFLDQHGDTLLPRQDCQILCALARWKGHLPPSSMTSFLAHTQRRLHSYSPADLHHVLWALSNLGPLPFLPPQPWLAAWMVAARPQLRLFGPDGIVTVVKTFSIWQLCPPKDFVQDVLEVSAGLARARAMTPRQLSRVIRGVADLRIPLLPDADRPPRWSREVLTAFAGLADAADATDLALVCACLPHLLSSGGRRAGREPGGAAEPAAATAVAAAPASAMHPLTLPVVRVIADAAAARFGAMSGVQLHGLAVGLARVHFPAGSAWMDAHARAVASRVVELQEGQLENVEKAYGRMRRCRLRAVHLEQEERREGGRAGWGDAR